VGGVVNVCWQRWAGIAFLAALLPGTAFGQSAPQAPAAARPEEAPASRLWVVAGGAFVAQRGDCQTCEEDFAYRQAGGVLADVGYSVTRRMDVGGELFWTSAETASGHIRTTQLDAVAQFRPWTSTGFFLKGGAGMAFVRNWVDASGPDAITSKALSVVIGGGWAFRPGERVGLQIFAMQHASALGDLQTANGEIGDVMGNFWSIGAAIVFR
jgi:hypothetical protein